MKVSRRNLLLCGLGAVSLGLLGASEDLRIYPVDRSPVARIKYPALAAHRGGAMIHPEETIAAFKQTVRDYPGMVLEMDVRALGDGSLVMWHDDSIDRLAVGGKKGLLKDLVREDWEDLWVKHPLGGQPAPAAFLQDVLDEFGGSDVVLMIETKWWPARDQIIDMVWPYRGQVILATFRDSHAEVFGRTEGINGQHLFSMNLDAPYAAGSQCIAVNYRAITKKVADDVHAMGAYLWAWTVDDKPTIDRLLNMGVDGFITNDPRLTV